MFTTSNWFHHVLRYPVATTAGTSTSAERSPASVKMAAAATGTADTRASAILDSCLQAIGSRVLVSLLFCFAMFKIKGYNYYKMNDTILF